jgi:PAS domain-containing protein
MPSRENASRYLESALAALGQPTGWKEALDRLPVPTYTTNAKGDVTYWNKACVEFAGREPQLGHDRWCVTWKLYTTAGKPLPHEDCPMAEAIKRKCEIRDEVAIALRPDGTRRAFTPYPTPLFDKEGELTGAVNLLIDVSDEQAVALAEQAARCQRLSKEISSKADAKLLAELGAHYSDLAAALQAERRDGKQYSAN